MAVETVLDPRYKMKLIEYYFPKIYGASAFQEIERVHVICLDLVKMYEIKLNMDEVNYYLSPVMSSQLEIGGQLC